MDFKMSQGEFLSDLELCQEAVEAHPDMGQITGGLLASSRLSGLTNRVYGLEAEKGSFVLRLPRPENAALIDRAQEFHNLSIAVSLGIAVGPLFLDKMTGVLLLPKVAISKGGWTPTDLGHLLARLHESKDAFQGRLAVSRLIGKEKAGLLDDPTFVGSYASFVAEAERLLEQVETSPVVASHCDLSPGNILAREGGPVLIDFEYSTMAPAGWDLAYAIRENNFDLAAERDFLGAYEAGCEGRIPDATEISHFKVLCDVVSMLWALNQAALGNAAGDFDAFARLRYERADALLKAL